MNIYAIQKIKKHKNYVGMSIWLGKKKGMDFNY